MATNTRIPGTIIRSGSIPTTALTGGVVSSSVQVTTLLPGGSVSSSAQVTELLPMGVVSSSAQYPGWVTGSSQIDITATTNYTSFSSSIATKNDIQDVSITALNSATSSYAINTTIQSQLAGVASSSGQVKTYLPVDSVSSSQQVTAFLPTNTVSSSGQISLSGISGTTFSNNDFSFPLNVTVNGLLTATSQSVIYITSSQLNVGSNDIILNTTEQLRFGGLTVFDSGSANQSGSLFWDSLNNVWLYVHAGTSNTSSILITGPENTGVLGSEQFLTQNRVSKAGINGDHIVDSQISDNGTTVGMTGNLSVTGSINAASVTVTGAISGSAVSASTLTGTLQTAAQTNVTSVGTLSSLTLNGQITSTTTSSAIISAQPAGTTSRYVVFSNTSGDFYTGIEASTGASLLGGASAYARVFGTSAAYPLEFFTNNVKRLTIDSSGNVGIGTDNPATELDIFTTSDGIEGISARSSAGGFIRLLPSASVGAYNGITSRADNAIIFGNGSGGGRLVIAPSSSITSGLVISGSSGNVGIGTTNPSEKFEVSGKAAITSDGVILWGAAKNYGTLTWDSGKAIVHSQSGLALSLGGGGNLDHLYIKTDGKVGIGTTNPNVPLSVYSTTTAAINFRNSTNIGTTFGFTIEATGNNSEFWNYANGWMRFATNNVERMRILENGNVGIGTTNPITLLHVKGTDSLTANTRYIKGWIGGAGTWGANSYEELGVGFSGIRSIYISGDNWDLAFSTGTSTTFSAGTQAERMRIDSSGRLLVGGTTAPTVGGFTDTRVVIKQIADGGSGGGLQIEQNSNTNIAFFGFDGNAFNIGTSYRSTGAYQPIRFLTSGATRIHISNDGNVGIGTTDPQTRLHVLGGNTAEGQVRVYNTDVTYTSGINFYTTTTERGFVGWRYTNSTAPFNAAGMYLINRDNSNIIFGTNNLERVRIDTNGNVGIGTTDPGNFRLRVPYSGVVTNAAPVEFNGPGTAAWGIGLVIRTTGGTDGAAILFRNRDSKNWQIRGETSGTGFQITEDGGDATYGSGFGTVRVTIAAGGNVLPGANGTQDLGSSSLRWSTVYTSDLSLSNGVGDWTIVEGEDDLFIYNNKNNKVYKFTLQEVDPSTATPKKS